MGSPHVTIVDAHHIKSMYADGMSKRAISRASGHHPATIAKVLNGTIHLKGIEVAERMADAGLPASGMHSSGNTRSTPATFDGDMPSDSGWGNNEGKPTSVFQDGEPVLVDYGSPETVYEMVEQAREMLADTVGVKPEDVSDGDLVAALEGDFLEEYA